MDEKSKEFVEKGVDEILNLQPRGSQAKPYQVKQVRDLILKYPLEIDCYALRIDNLLE